MSTTARERNNLLIGPLVPVLVAVVGEIDGRVQDTGDRTTFAGHLDPREGRLHDEVGQRCSETLSSPCFAGFVNLDDFV